MDDRKKVLQLALGILAIMAAAVGIYYFLLKKPVDRTGSQSQGGGAPAAVAEKAETEVPPGVLNLPGLELEKSDALLRGLVRDISSHPGLSVWMKTREIVRKFVAAVDNIANGLSPKAQIDFFAPSREFRASKRDGRYIVDPTSYDRYNPVVDVFISLDDKASARLYAAIKPLFAQAYTELGYPDTDFQDTLTRAIAELLQTPVVEGRIYLDKKVSSYAMIDETLEGLDQAQKQFLRMGPENVQVVQTKLRALALACGIPEYRLPKPRIYVPGE
jgi:hypothetical protein